MAELRGGRDEPDDGEAFARRFPADAGDGAGEAWPRHEPSPRAEFAEVMRQETGQANVGQADRSQADRSQADRSQADRSQADRSQAGPGQADTAQENTDQADAVQGKTDQADAAPIDVSPDDAGLEDVGQSDTDQTDAEQADGDHEHADQVGADQAVTDPSAEGSLADALERFDPRRAGLPEISHADAAAYIEKHIADRPWLALARDCSPDAQRVFVALDQGRGHAHIRHEGWVTEEMNERRLRCLEDPAQLDQDKREAGIDGLKSGDQPHRCGGIATRITDPEAFAMAFARGVEHPEVRAALDSPVPVPRPVDLPISEVLGDDGHKFCSGWQLEPVNGSMLEAVANREAWLAGNRDEPEPGTRPVKTFEGGTVTFVFRPSTDGGHEIITMYVNPPDE